MITNATYTLRGALLWLTIVAIVGCAGGSEEVTRSEDKQAKATIQGVWIDADSEEPVFRISGDTLTYADNTTEPALFAIIDDTLFVGQSDAYPIARLTRNSLTITNHNGDEISLIRTDEQAKVQPFTDGTTIAQPTEQVKSDTVVTYAGERYHLYTAINPTTFRVVVPSYTDEGMRVENTYYDNIIHISIFKGKERLFSQDFHKADFSTLVPQTFITQAVLTNMELYSVDIKGFHIACKLCIPNDAGCYLLEALITYEGQVTLSLIDY